MFTVTYEYNTQIHSTTGGALLQLILCNPNERFPATPASKDLQAITTPQYLRRGQQWLGYFVKQVV